MTLGAMWVRTVGTTAELVVASDSRVCGGKRWDHCPKILPLARGDCIVSFSGETDYAFPLILHIVTTIDSWEESRNRRFTLENLRGHLVRVLNSALSDIDYSNLSGTVNDQAFLLFGGYSWRSQKWVIWRLSWDAKTRQFTHRTLYMRRHGQRGGYLLTGDSDAIGEAHRRLNGLLRSRGRTLERDGLDMEPFEVIRDVIRDQKFTSVGGPLQMGKVYRNLDARLFIVKWRDDAGELRDTLSGRYLLSSEVHTRLHALDPDRPNVFSAQPEE